MNHASSQIRTVVLGLLVCALLGACARDADDWKAAAAADTPEAYAAFLQRHPQSAQAAAARTRSAELTEKRAWDLATQSDTSESYRQFLAQHADGDWAQEARVRIANFELAEAAPAPVQAAVAAAAGSAAPIRAAAPVEAAPPATAAAPVRSAAPGVAAAPARAAGRARVQLGAFSARDKAQAEWLRLSGRFKVLADLKPDYVQGESGGKPVFRLQTEVEDAAAADALCATLKASRQGCIRLIVR